MTAELNLNRIDKQRYRPAAEVEDILDDLRRNLVTGEKYRVARLAIARSLVQPEGVEPLPRGTEMGNSIEGQTLLGDDSAVWSCLIVESYSKLITTVEEFRAVLEAHWTRGARLLQNDLEQAHMRSAGFINALAGMARGSPGASQDGPEMLDRSGAVSVKIGEVSRDLRTDAEVDVVLNALGVSPHFAILGKTRSGKTRAGLAIAEQIVANSQLPMLLIDPRGEFVTDGQLIAKSDWEGKTLADRISGIRPIDVPKQTIPLDFLARTAGSQPIELAQLAMSFRDSLQKCIRNLGDIALDSFQEAVQQLLATNRGPVSLEIIRDAVRSANELSVRGKDTIEAKLNELCALRLFEPKMGPDEFFSRRWVIGLAGATEESRRLVISVLLNALAKHLLGQKDSETDRAGARTLRHLLVIDESKAILSLKHRALGDLVRKSGAKGGVVMLLSQSPDDFEQEDEDFLEQIGHFIVFASTANSVKNLRAAFGRRLAPENFSDRDLPRGVAWAKLPDLDLFKLRVWAVPHEE